MKKILIMMLSLLLLFSTNIQVQSEFVKHDIEVMDYHSKLESMKSSYEGSLKRGMSTSALNFDAMLRFSDDVSIEEMNTYLQKYKFKILGSQEHRLVSMVYKDVLDLESRFPNVIEYFEKTVNRQSQAVNDPFFDFQWAIKKVNVENAWNYSTGTSEQYICVIDTGIYREHEDLIYADIRNGWDYIANDNVFVDSGNHGTSVTGVIAASTNNNRGIAGISRNASIVPLRILDTDGYTTSDRLVEALYDAANLGCRVINLSLGGPTYSYFEELAINYAISQGSIVIAAAGNNGTSNYSYPASYQDVISVGSTDASDSKIDFSQYNNRVTVVAPGELVYTLDVPTYKNYYSLYNYKRGTSFSAPIVSGIASLALSLDPSLNHYTFKNLLISTAKDLYTPGYDHHTGFGLVDAERVLQKIMVGENQPISLSWSKLPKKTSYIYGEELQIDDGRLFAHYVDGSIKEVNLSLDMINGYNSYPEVYGKQTLTVDYLNISLNFDVSVDRFRDVPFGHQVYTRINDLAGKGIINGYSDGTFRPNANITRAQAAIMIVRAIGLDTSGASSNFNDVPSTHSAYAFISAANQAGIIGGYSVDNTYRPNEYITRQQIAIMIQRAFSVEHSGSEVYFSDVTDKMPSKRFIEALASNKIINGYSDGTFRPTNNTTRAQFSSMIYNAMKYGK